MPTAWAESSSEPSTNHLADFGKLYAVQWGFYLIAQGDAVRDHGSFKNWYDHMLEPHFDNDNLEYNVVKHSFAGSYYFLYYRWRGNARKEAFLWTVASSLAFEFTIETVSEQPSYQDIFITPMFGTALGIALDNTSAFLVRQPDKLSRGLGYLLNPFNLFTDTTKPPTAAVSPVIRKDYFGAIAEWRF
jgi:hypothetical protein